MASFGEKWNGKDWENSLPDQSDWCDGLGCPFEKETCLCAQVMNLKEKFRKEFKRPWRSLEYEEQKKFLFGFHSAFDRLKSHIVVLENELRELRGENRVLKGKLKKASLAQR